MPRELDKLGGAIRLAEDQRRMLERHTSIHDDVQRAAERMRNIVDSPLLRELRGIHERFAALSDPPYLRQVRDILDATQLRGFADLITGITPKIDSGLFAGGISRQLLDDWRTQPADHFAGLKALMPVESLSATIARSWMVDVEAVSAARRAADVFRAVPFTERGQALSDLAGISTQAHQILGSLDVNAGFADLLNVSGVTRSLLGFQTDRVNRAYAGFAASVKNRPEWLASVPDALWTTPSYTALAQARFVRAVTTHDDVEEQDAADEIWAGVQAETLAYIEAVLPELNPKLMKSWEGTWAAARRRGPDWARQSASSLRFLLIEVLESVAPVEEVRKSTLPPRYIRDGQILRLGQIHWLCEPVSNRTYGKVVRADLDSTMTIIEAMNEAVHRGDYQEIEGAFGTMAVRAAVALCNLLKLWKARA